MTWNDLSTALDILHNEKFGNVHSAVLLKRNDATTLQDKTEGSQY